MKRMHLEFRSAKAPAQRGAKASAEPPRVRLTGVLLLAAAVMSLAASGAAQTPQASPLPESPLPPGGRVELRFDTGRPVLRIGQDYTLRPGDVVREVVVVLGDTTIEGIVERDVVVVLGKARISGTASIDGSLIVVGGSTVVTPGASIRRDLVVVAGAFDAPAGFSAGGQQIVIGPRMFGGTLEAFVPWITRGLLWGRPIVPDLPWVWGIVGFLFVVYLVVSLLLHEPVRASAETLVNKPLTTFAVGLLVLLLTGPVCLLLAVSVIGLAVVPFLLCALCVAWMVGKVGVARWIGMSVVPQDSPESRAQSVRSFAIGFALICLAYMVPIVGFVAWTMVGVLGLGAATLAVIAGYRHEHPAPTPREPPPPMPAPPPREYVSASPAVDAPEGALTPPESTAPIVASDLASFPRAAFKERLAAFVLDLILVLITAQTLNLMRHDDDPRFFVLLLAYHIGFWTWKGTTVGGIICQLRVVRVDGAPLTFADALVRGLSSIFSLAVLGLGVLWILKDPERQAWHDKIAGTYVVKVPRNWPL